MDNHQEDKLSMYQVVRDHLGNNQSIWQAVLAFVNAESAFRTEVAGTESLAQQQQQTSKGAPFVIWISEFFRHSSLGLRHSSPFRAPEHGQRDPRATRIRNARSRRLIAGPTSEVWGGETSPRI